MSDLAANPIAQRERAWWDQHTDYECVWDLRDPNGVEIVGHDDGVAACLDILDGPGFLATVLHDNSNASDVVDLGCGPGRLLLPLAVKYPHITFTSVDVAPKMLAAVPTPLPDNVTLSLCGGRSIPVDSGSVDAVYSVLVFQHLPVEAQALYLLEAARVLVSGGKFVVQVVADDGPQPGQFLSHSTDVKDLWRLADDFDFERVVSGKRMVFPTWAWLSFEKR